MIQYESDRSAAVWLKIALGIGISHFWAIYVCFSSQTPHLNSDFPQIRLLERVQQSGNMHEPSPKSYILYKYMLPTGFMENFSFGILESLQLPTLSAACSDSGLYFNMMQNHSVWSPYAACCLKELLFVFSEWMHFSVKRIDSSTAQAELSTVLCFSVSRFIPARWVWKAAKS